MYKLYTDKIENFEAKIKLEGASLKKSKARLVVEADGFDVMFRGTIDDTGNVKIPVKRLRGLIDENTKGTYGKTAHYKHSKNAYKRRHKYRKSIYKNKQA
mgnify:CR=1 FL=1